MDTVEVSVAAPPMAHVALNTKQTAMNTSRSTIMSQNLKDTKAIHSVSLFKAVIQKSFNSIFQLTQIKPMIPHKEEALSREQTQGHILVSASDTNYSSVNDYEKVWNSIVDPSRKLHITELWPCGSHKSSIISLRPNVSI